MTYLCYTFSPEVTQTCITLETISNSNRKLREMLFLLLQLRSLEAVHFFLRLGGSFITYFTGVIFAKYFCNILVQLSVVLVTNKCAWCELLRWLQKSGVSNKLMWLNYQKKIWLRVYHRVPFIHSAGEQSRGGKKYVFSTESSYCKGKKIRGLLQHTSSFASVRKGSSTHGHGIAFLHDVEVENENLEANENPEANQTAFCHIVDPWHYFVCRKVSFQ